MLTFKPITRGTSITATNQRLRIAYEAINELEARLAALECSNEAETVSDSPVIEKQPVTVDAAEVVDDETPFDWINCEDKDELEQYGRTIGIELDKRCKVETMQKLIAEKLGVAE